MLMNQLMKVAKSFFFHAHQTPAERYILKEMVHLRSYSHFWSLENIGVLNLGPHK